MGRCAAPVVATEQEHSLANFTLEDEEDDALNDGDFDEVVDSDGSDDDDSDEEEISDGDDDSEGGEEEDVEDEASDEEDGLIDNLPETVAFVTVATVTQGSVELDSSLPGPTIFSFLSGIWNRFRASLSVLFGAVGERVRRKDVLSNKKRKKMYNFILRHPGSHFRDVLRATKASPNEGAWHLRILEKTGCIKSSFFGRYLVYYPNGYRDENQKWSWNARFILRQNMALKIAKSLEGNPGVQVKELAELLSIHPNTIRYHVKRFEELGLVKKISCGRTTRLFLEPGIDDLIRDVESEPLQNQ